MSLVTLQNVTFSPDNFIPLNTILPDDSFAPGGPALVDDPGFPASNADLGQPDTFTIMDITTSTATSYRLGTAMIQDTGPGGNIGGPFEVDILGANATSLLLGTGGYNPTPSPGIGYYQEYAVVSTASLDDPTYPLSFTFDANAFPCFASGTRIATSRGDVAVEDILVGDEVRTVSGALRPVVWAGSRFVDLARHTNPDLVRPVRIAAGALDTNVPSRDLVVSPDHNLFIEGVLIPAKCLVNGTTVTSLDVAGVRYHHIELDSHDVILAEGAAAETYLDTGNRTAFAGQGVTDAHPDFSTAPDTNYFAWEAKGCARLVLSGPELDRAVATLAQRAGILSIEARSTALVA